VVAIILAVAPAALGLTYHTITVDGDISDFDPPAELIWDDAPTDCHWENNDLDDLFLTWDQDALYVGVMFRLEVANSINLYFDLSLPGGAQDLGTVAWPKFYYTVGWRAHFSVNVAGDGTLGIFRIYDDCADEEITDTYGSELAAATTFNDDRTGAFECRLPWTVLYPDGIPARARIGTVAVLTGFREYAGADAAPDQTPDVGPGPEPYDILDIIRSVSLDADGNSVPEQNWDPRQDRGWDDIPPVVTATADPTSGSAPLFVVFTGTASDPGGGEIISYIWDFGDGGTSTAPVAPHVYEDPGSYTAALTVVDDEGDTTTSPSISISVTGAVTTPILRLYLSQVQPDCFTAGRLFDLRVIITNPYERPFSADLYVLLDVFGEYFFYPGWGAGMDKQRITAPAAAEEAHQILLFNWPQTDAGRIDNIMFHAAIFAPLTFDLIEHGCDTINFSFE